MAVMAGGAWVAGERIVSPAEAAARTAAAHSFADSGADRTAGVELGDRHARHGPVRHAAGRRAGPLGFEGEYGRIADDLAAAEHAVQGRRCAAHRLRPAGDGSSGHSSGLSRPRARHLGQRCAAVGRSRSSDWGSIRATWMETTTRKPARRWPHGIKRRATSRLGQPPSSMRKAALAGNGDGRTRSRTSWRPPRWPPRPIWR